MMVNNEDLKKNKRRSKNTVSNEKYICGCEKSYLSYAALFTHLKNSHNKIVPNGTIIPLKKKEGLRGRPKKQIDNETSNIQKKTNNNKDESSEDSDEGIDSALDEFFYYLENIEKFQKKTSFRLSSIQNHYDFADLSFFSNDEKKEYMPIYELLIAFSKHPNHLEELIENEKKRKNASLDEAFSIFLIKISQNLKPQFFQEITFLLCVYRNVLFQEKTKYEQFDTNFFLEKSEFDYLLINTFREMLEKRKLYLGEELIDVMQLKDFVKHLRNWLNRCHFTEIGD